MEQKKIEPIRDARKLGKAKMLILGPATIAIHNNPNVFGDFFQTLRLLIFLEFKYSHTLKILP